MRSRVARSLFMAAQPHRSAQPVQVQASRVASPLFSSKLHSVSAQPHPKQQDSFLAFMMTQKLQEAGNHDAAEAKLLRSAEIQDWRFGGSSMWLASVFDLYQPTTVGQLLAETLCKLAAKGYASWTLPKVEVALDVGCGLGHLSILLSQACGANHVVALDIDERCTQATKANWTLNGLSQSELTTRCGTMQGLEAMRGKLQLIVCNPPHLPACMLGSPSLFNCPPDEDGRGVLDDFLKRAGDLLAPGGLLLTTDTSIIDCDRTDALLNSEFGAENWAVLDVREMAVLTAAAQRDGLSLDAPFVQTVLGRKGMWEHEGQWMLRRRILVAKKPQLLPH